MKKFSNVLVLMLLSAMVPAGVLFAANVVTFQDKELQAAVESGDSREVFRLMVYESHSSIFTQKGIRQSFVTAVGKGNSYMVNTFLSTSSSKIDADTLKQALRAAGRGHVVALEAASADSNFCLCNQYVRIVALLLTHLVTGELLTLQDLDVLSRDTDSSDDIRALIKQAWQHKAFEERVKAAGCAIMMAGLYVLYNWYIA